MNTGHTTSTASAADIGAELAAIEQALDSHTYKKGAWLKLLRHVDPLPADDRKALAPTLNRVSDKLHQLNGFPRQPVALGLIMEVVLLVVALTLLNADALWARVIAVGALALSLQPSLKIAAGLLLGVRYSYVFLWYFEPRFKMRYGTYMALPRINKVLFQLAGSVGTPLALLIGFFVFSDSTVLAALSLLGSFVTALMQVAAFVAAWCGVRKVGPFLLTSLTTPATAAREVKALLDLD